MYLLTTLPSFPLLSPSPSNHKPDRFFFYEILFVCLFVCLSFPHPLDCKEIQPVHSEGDQPWDFFGRNDAKAETPVLWPPHVKIWLTGKESDAGRDWGQEEKGTPEDEMAGWHHWLDGLESEWTPGVCDGQGSLACCDSWGHKESDTTEGLTWNEQNWYLSKVIQYVSFSVWLISLSIMPSRSIHVVSNDFSHFWLNNITVFLYHNFLFLLFIGGHLGCFHLPLL